MAFQDDDHHRDEQTDGRTDDVLQCIFGWDGEIRYFLQAT